LVLYNPLIASEETYQEEAIKAVERKLMISRRSWIALRPHTTFAGAARQLDVASTKYSILQQNASKRLCRLSTWHMAIDGNNAEAVAQALEIMRSGVEMHMLLQGGTPEDLRIYFTNNTYTP
jgi:hypothetical protein